jgi:hypothetical protein
MVLQDQLNHELKVNRLSLGGLQLEVIFDMQTLRGVKMLDNYGGDKIWDTCLSPTGISVNITSCGGGDSGVLGDCS